MPIENSEYTICTRCVMDTSDPWISFDEHGVCNHCRNFEQNIKPNWFPNDQGQQKLIRIANEIKSHSCGKEYDCIIGVSGGVDSSYLLYVAKELLGLRPLAVHIDAGWNSELAVRNIESLTKGLNVDLFTYVVNWDEIRDMQLAYLQSSLANQDVPQDHAFFAKLYEFAVNNRIKYVLTGSNFATESILPKAWGYNPMDARQMLAIHRKFGKEKLNDFPVSGLFRTYVYYPYIRQMKVVKPLNLMHYNVDEAIQFLSERFGWVYYGGKHFESRWTRFFQSYYLPVKFGFDKRRPHLSSLIVSGQRERTYAMAELQKPAFDQDTLRDDLNYIAKKLRITPDEFRSLIELPNKNFSDYENNFAFEQALRFGLLIARKFRLGV